MHLAKDGHIVGDPDYLQTPEQLYLHFAKRHVRTTNSLAILNWAQGTRNRKGLPGWVPDWTPIKLDIFQGTSSNGPMFGIHSVGYLQRGLTCGAIFPADRPRSLMCTGKVFRKISRTTSQLQRFNDTRVTFRILSEHSFDSQQAAETDMSGHGKLLGASSSNETVDDVSQLIRAGESLLCLIYGCSTPLVLCPSSVEWETFSQNVEHLKETVNSIIEPLVADFVHSLGPFARLLGMALVIRRRRSFHSRGKRNTTLLVTKCRTTI